MVKGVEKPKNDVKYGHVDNKADIDRIFGEIRDDIKHAHDRERLTELYRRAGYLITLTYAPAWEKRFGETALALRKEAETDFRKTARLINARAGDIGERADYDEAWGKMKD
ncbi:hypothetical protein [Asticcacaulis sp.]|uniref:hypothetical protein n=1 Tax=Asticcacaulis sp. TaxID=1872648 RepID=UPI002CE77C64|nr:hypothetical protein [Asticcacaulis sp.]HTM80445.1 hypothetical protein [Asticcacaulis sp.]